MNSLRSSAIPLFKLKVNEKGRIRDIKETICRVEGLPSCLNGQLVDFGDGVKGIVMGYDEHDVLVLVLGDAGRLRMGKDVTGVSEPFKIAVGNRLVGRMITALGIPCDQQGDVEADDYYPVFRDSPPITHRAPVDEPLPVGTKMVDIFMPLATGQRLLILGDRMTGKTAIAIDAMINQRGRDVICIYCAIGKSLSALEKATSALHEAGALAYTAIVVATDAAPVGEQYLVPFAAASIGDYFASRGKKVLVVFDDLTKHAWAYRQLSLLLERPPGREAYPGDIFYVQTQLMERAGRFNEAHGNGSMTFLGIAETQQGDLTGYIPSNLASMCDGQICMSTTLFAEGFRPAIDLTLSLSIIGGKAQPPIIKALSRNLRADFARYNEVKKLSKMQSGLSEDAEKLVRRGESITSVLRQGQYAPVCMAEEVLLLYALERGVLSMMTEEERTVFRKGIYALACKRNQPLVDEIGTKRELTLAIEKGLGEIMQAFLDENPPAAAKG